MKVTFKATAEFLSAVRRDLARPHSFAFERVGFISVRASAAAQELILFSDGYYPVEDGDYVDDPSVGAQMSQEAIRKALEKAMLKGVGMFHVHAHDHIGRPIFSRTDLKEQVKFVPDFFKVRRQLPHGAIVLSKNSAAGRTWIAPGEIVPITEFIEVGAHIKFDIAPSSGRTDILV